MLSYLLLTFLLTPLVLSTSHHGYAHSHNSNLIVETRTGTFVGNLNDTYPDVRQFKYIPFAKPPVGSQRWTSPEPLDNSSAVHDSTVFGPSCSQFVSAINVAWALNISGNLIVNYGESLEAGLVAQNSAEDCLSLAIWTPADVKPDAGLPVMLFITGGGDVTGGVNIPAQIPPNWVHRSQKHIAVSINYRLNIFGFPNARGLNGTTNFGLQDQRLAVEWVAENIAAFGGDPTKITMWGQSAGASAADMYLFAHPNDPIVRGSVSSSGLAVSINPPVQDPSHSNFTFVAKAMGCDFEDPAVELDCMRRIPMPRIVNFYGQYQDNSTLVNKSQPSISFRRQIDNKLVFSDYPSRYVNGQLAKLPKMIGTTAREASPQVPYPINNVTAGPWEPPVVSGTLNTVCAAYNTSVYRTEADLPTYRYQWAGNFSNLSPLPWLGAYHFSDLYMLMGTYLIAPGDISDLERQTSEKMQDYLLEFVIDPEGFASSGWPDFNTMQQGGGKLARFGADGQAVQFVDGNEVDGACHLPGYTYDTSP